MNNTTGKRIWSGLALILACGLAILGFALYIDSRVKLEDEIKYRRTFEFATLKFAENLEIVSAAYKVDEYKTYEFPDLNTDRGSTSDGMTFNLAGTGIETGVLRWCVFDGTGGVPAYADAKLEIVRPDNTLFTVPPGANGYELRVVKRSSDTPSEK